MQCPCSYICILAWLFLHLNVDLTRHRAPCSKPEVKVLRVSGEPVSVKDLTTSRTVMALLRHLG